LQPVQNAQISSDEKGIPLSSLDFASSAAKYPRTCYWDFHRSDLHRVLIDRAIELGGTVECNAKAVDVRMNVEDDMATVSLRMEGDDGGLGIGPMVFIHA